jgi:hypothetical protein
MLGLASGKIPKNYSSAFSVGEHMLANSFVMPDKEELDWNIPE